MKENIKIEQDQMAKEINEEDMVGKAISLFGHSTDILIVNDKKNNYSGILAEWAILRSNMDISSAKVKNFKFHAPKVSKDTPVPESARLMVENNLLYLPVFEGDKITGVVGYKDILTSPIFKEMGNEPIMGMTSQINGLSADDKISVVFNRFKQDKLFSLPVLEDGAFLGTVSLHDVINTLPQHQMKQEREGYSRGRKTHVMDMSVKKIMSHPRTSVHEDARVSEVITKLLSSELDSIRVLDGNNKLKGVITVMDLLKLTAGQETVTPLPKVQINSDVPDLNRAEVDAAVLEFLDRYGERLAESRVEIYMRGCGQPQKDQNMIMTRIRIFSHKEAFTAAAEEYGDIHSVKSALSKLETQIEKAKHENRPRQGNRPEMLQDRNAS